MNYKPVPKIKNAMITGAVVYLLTILLQEFGIELTPELANGLPVLSALVVGWWTRDKEREELLQRVEGYIEMVKGIGEEK